MVKGAVFNVSYLVTLKVDIRHGGRLMAEGGGQNADNFVIVQISETKRYAV